MSPTNTPSASANTLSPTTPYNVPDAALRGAALAFSAKPPVKPKPVIDALGGNGRSRSVSPNHHARRQTKTQSLYERRADPPGLSMSPSMAAASLAAARHSPIVNKSPSFTTGREHISESGSRSKWTEPVGKEESYFAPKEQSRTKLQGEESATDSTSIAPTTSLVQLFEENSKSNARSAGTKHAATNRIATTKVKPPLIVAPKPQRSIPIHSVSEELERPLGSRHVRRQSDVNHEIEKPAAHATRSKSEEDIAAGKPIIPPPRRAAKGKQEKPVEPLKSATQKHSQGASPIFTDTHPTLSPFANRPSRSILDTPPNLPTSPSPKPYLTSTYKEASLRQISPHITGDHLANAIVGAHLAASRQLTPSLASSTKQRPRPPSPRRKNKHDHHHRSVSPAKREPGKLRHTLRRNASAEFESGNGDRQKGFNRIVNKHPHKHSEGTRKRWRDAITERERKRYEGVWAANKGLNVLSASGGPPKEFVNDDVLSLVVRDIWLRSRLPARVLEEVWSLVDRRGIGRLTKEEFVVGLWLIDQRLKGSKLPPRVGDSVWASVTGLGTRGVKVRLKDRGGKKKR